MGASRRTNSVIAACCLGLLASQPALADSQSWLDKIGSITSSLIPDINLAAYLDGSAHVTGSVPTIEPGRQPEPGRANIWDFDQQLVATPPASGFRYELVDSDSRDIGSSAGVYLLSLDPNVRSKVSGLARSTATDARMPTYRLDLGYTISPHWSLGMRGHFLDIETSDLDSSQSAYSAAIEYAAGDDMSVGFGYEQFEMHGDPQLQNLPGYVSYSYSGPRVYSILRF